MSSSGSGINPLALAAFLVALAIPPGLASPPAVDALPSAAPLRPPGPRIYQLESAPSPGARWVRARQAGRSTTIEFGSRVVLQVAPDTDLAPLLAGRPLRLDRQLPKGLLVVQATDASTAFAESIALTDQPGVVSCRPVLRRPFAKNGRYANRPNDPRFGALWPLENRAADGTQRGPDLNARGAWAHSWGAGVTVAVVDDGVELTHPDLASALSNGWHYDFTTKTPGGGPTGPWDTHATEVAGLIAARDNNRRGIAGLAPRASLVSWKIFNGAYLPLSDEDLMDLFSTGLQEVPIQNHSWGNAGAGLFGPTDLEQIGLTAAFQGGRHGLGVVMVRAGGNYRLELHNTNDDGYANDPRVIAVGAVGHAGRVAPYSSPGACLLVSAFGGTTNGLQLTTTDRVGVEGSNTTVTSGDDADYVTGVIGTSFATPQISGLVALLLSVNPSLTIRDVQHLLLLASRPLDPGDPDSVTNRAGLVHSHNTGFGVPDAGQAAAWARTWTPRPALVERRFALTSPVPVPDDGLRVLVTSDHLPPPSTSIPSTPALGAQADDPTGPFPLVDLGVATNDITLDLTGRAALIQRGPSIAFTDDRTTFRRKLERAAAAGASLALVYNHRDLTRREVMSETDFIPIPAVFLGQTDGEALRNQLAADATMRVALQRTGADLAFVVPDSLACEHVGLHVATSHPRRGDLRIVLRSPHGTRSVMQRLNFDTDPGPEDWTFWSTRHFGEPSAGTWTVEITDQAPGNLGAVTQLELILRGTPITDSDRDGLDDAWEQSWFGSLEQDSREDPDGDLVSNLREAWLHTDPTRSDRDPRAWFNALDAGRGRLSWETLPGRAYEVRTATNLPESFLFYTNGVTGSSAMELILPVRPDAARYFEVEEIP